MDKSEPLRNLLCEWARYLEQRGHQVRQESATPQVLVSRNGQGRGFRWVVFQAKEARRRFTAIEHETIQRQIRRGRESREQVYVVVKFETPVPRIVVMPAAKASKMRTITSERAGIPWDG